MNKKIAAIVVTYNRKELLADCLKAICAQEYKPDCVYVMDNASSDGTDEWIKENGYDGEKSGIQFRYVRLPANIGGAGGFHTGLKMAHEAEDMFDAFWLMDDDGVPDKAQLRNLLAYSNQYDYISPLVVAKEDKARCAFYNCSVEEFKAKAIDGVIKGIASPFNGVLYSRKLVNTIGYPIKEMFIWGDEVNYHFRCINGGFEPVTVEKAIHIHPINRQKQTRFWKWNLVIPEQEWKLYILIRNGIYNLKQNIGYYSFLRKAIKRFIKYSLYFTFAKPSFSKIKLVFHATADGANEDFSKLSVYMNH